MKTKQTQHIKKKKIKAKIYTALDLQILKGQKIIGRH